MEKEDQKTVETYSRNNPFNKKESEHRREHEPKKWADDKEEAGQAGHKMKSEKDEKSEGEKLGHNSQSSSQIFTSPIIALTSIVVILVLVNQFQLSAVTGMLSGAKSGGFGNFGNKDISNIDINQLKSTAHTVAAVFPVENIKTTDDAIAIMFPTGTPEYGDKLGVSFDEPVGSLEKLANMYPGLRVEVQKSNPDGWSRFMALASKPVGISCEYCCGIGTIGIKRDGSSACGCQHNPALLSIALYLSAYTDYTDGEILTEVMRWKTLFFPKNMIGIGMTVAGGDTSALQNLPGMVGGC